MKLKALIIDDEFNARENLKLLIHDHCPDLDIIGFAESAESARDVIKSTPPDIVFLDIAMPNEDGFEFLRSFDETGFSVIFTTAYNEYALKAFKANAIDYLEKPISIDELKNAVEKSLKYQNGNNTNATNDELTALMHEMNNSKSSDRISIPTRNGYLIIRNQDIVHLEASDNYTMIYLNDGSRHLSSKNIKIYEENLDENIFFRTHKSHIINIENHLKEFSRSEGNVAIMTNGKYVPISRRKMTNFMERINTF